MAAKPWSMAGALVALALCGSWAEASWFCHKCDRPTCLPSDHPSFGYYPTQWSAWPAPMMPAHDQQYAGWGHAGSLPPQTQPPPYASTYNPVVPSGSLPAQTPTQNYAPQSRQPAAPLPTQTQTQTYRPAVPSGPLPVNLNLAGNR